METNQNSDIDFSNYSGSKKTAGKIVAPPDLDRENKKNKIYMIVIVICVLLGGIFWAMYLGVGKPAPSKTIPGAMINGAGPGANLPGGGPLPR
jgi:hypothetical protein